MGDVVYTQPQTDSLMVSHWINGGGGIDLHVDETGNKDGRDILFIHGYSQSRLSWTKQRSSGLTNDFHLVFVDARGHGKSEKPHDAYTNSELWAEDIRAVIETLDLDEPVLVGWSMGGLVVLDYLAKYGSDRVSGINLVGTTSALGTSEVPSFIGDDFLELVPGFESTDVEDSVQTLKAFVRRCFHDSPSPETLRYILGFNVIVPPYIRENINSRRVDHTDILPDLELSVLLTHGESDRIVMPAAAERHAKLIDQVEMSLYPETGHSPFWEAPARFNAEIREFINRL